MKEIPVTRLAPNSYFDQPVYLDPSYILLSPDTPLTAELVERLRRWGFGRVLSNGESQGNPEYLAASREEGMGLAADGLRPAASLEHHINEQKQLESTRRFYFTLLGLLTDRFKRFHSTNKLDLAELTDRVKEMIGMIKTSRDFVLRLKEYEFQAENYLPMHSLNSALLALAIGELLKLPPHRLIELGIAGLLHDIGMVKIPEALYTNPKALTPQEMKMVRAHTILGYRILKGFSLSEAIALPALEHHERLNGSGYPQAVTGERISLYSRVIAVTCSYDAMVSPRPFKRSGGGHAALLELLKNGKERYDERAVRALIYCLSLYPLGSLVVLSNNLRGRVVKPNPENPRYPLVRILVDPSGRRLGEQVLVQTSETDGVTVQRELTPEEAATVAG